MAPPKKPQPVELKPPGSVPDASAPRRDTRPLVILGLLSLLGLAVAVVLLPRPSGPGPLVSGHAPGTIAVPRSEDTSGDAESTAQALSAARLRAEQALRDLLRLRAALELARAPVWGDPEWSDAAAAVKRGDRLFLQRDFSDADVAYRDAIQKFQTIESTRMQRLESALQLGEQALAEDRHEDAVDHFEYVLAIDTEHVQANAALARAMVRERVLELMDTGRAAEGQGDLAAARAAYDEAMQLDTAYRPASEARQHVVAQIEQRAFTVAMSEAIQALDQARYPAAEQALQTAAELSPADDSVQDLRRRLATARRQSTLARLRTKALSGAAAEDWQAVVESYDKALKLDANAAFALTGLDQARARLRLHQQIDHYLASPARLTSDEPLMNAEQVLRAAGDPPAEEPVLANKLIALRQIVAQAKTPVRVELQSDGQTDVVIYRVGRQGRFLQHQLELRPGTYTAIGSRAGYRDVRRQFVVEPGAAPLVVSIRCEQPI